MKSMQLGATWLGDGHCSFSVWAPKARDVAVHILSATERTVWLEESMNGYFVGTVGDVARDSRYFYQLDGDKRRPDPASRYQPEGIYGPSQIVDTAYAWTDQHWFGIPLRDYLFYELHVGTFTPEGTFAAIIPLLPALKDLGVTALELMPIAQFPGSRNWGYDGAYPFAVQNSYGGPEGLRGLVDACHQQGMAVVLDVVYNHFGPEGNYLLDYGNYFTDQYHTPWGAAVNFDGPHSGEVRRYFVENALYWMIENHIDALRLDAVHAILDFSARPFLQQLAETVHDYAETINRRLYLIPESSLNDTRLIRSRELGGFGLDAQWNDDFHHAVHSLLTSERSGYYQDYGHLSQLEKAYREGFVYSGQYSSYRKRRFGNSSEHIPAQHIVVFAQNHDQVGNRMLGERLSQLVSLEGQKLAAGLVVLSPYLPLLFMGEEYGETAPFQYFISHTDADLVEAVRKGRKEEFSAFLRQEEPPDPQEEGTFLRCKLNHQRKHEGQHKALYELYRSLIALRKQIPALRALCKETMEVGRLEREHALLVRRWTEADEAFIIFYCSGTAGTFPFDFPNGRWQKRIDSADERWWGPGTNIPEMVAGGNSVVLSCTPWSFVLFTRNNEA